MLSFKKAHAGAQPDALADALVTFSDLFLAMCAARQRYLDQLPAGYTAETREIILAAMQQAQIVNVEAARGKGGNLAAVLEAPHGPSRLL
jgi:hypothetical protein